MPALASSISPASDTFRANAERMRELVADIADKAGTVQRGGSEESRQRHVSRGKLLPRERLAQLLDAGSPFLEIGQFAAWNMFISLSSFVLGLSTLVFVYNMVASWRSGPRAVANPWKSLTLEWQVSSPPPIFNFDNVPTVVGGPYEYGVPDAVHGIFKPAEEARPKQPAGASSAEGHE